MIPSATSAAPAKAANSGLTSPMVCQLTSRHALTDERILHRMAWTADKYGYRSVVAGPGDSDGAYGTIELVACPRGVHKQSLRVRLASQWHLLCWALRSDGRVFQFHDPELLLMAFALTCCGRKVIYDVHEDFEANMLDRMAGFGAAGRLLAKTWWLFERSIASWFDAVVVADRHVAAKFTRLKPLILGNFPRMDFTRPADATGEGTFNLVYVGGVTAERGITAALNALALLPRTDIRFHIAGDCRDSELLERLAAEPRVIYHGFVPWTSLSGLYEKAHLGLALYQPLESFTYFPGENTVKIIEYMAAGLPVLCSDFPGLRAFVETPGYGLAVKPDDPAAIAAVIEQFCSSPEFCRRLGRNARRAFEQEYNWEKHESKLADLYKRLAGADAGNRAGAQ
jgi:glycosyltransferase involved in cell wall biosynthesis